MRPFLLLAAVVLGSNAPPPKPVVPWTLLSQCNINSDNLPQVQEHVV
jgi:hypothetical protein